MEALQTEAAGGLEAATESEQSRLIQSEDSDADGVEPLEKRPAPILGQPGDHTEQGINLARKGFVEAALVEFEAAVRLDPSVAAYHFNVGVALSQLGRSAEALRSLEVALRLNPRHLAAMRAAAQVHHAMADCDAEIGLLRRLVGLAPERRDFQLDLARALRAAGRATEAVQILRQSLRTFGNDVELLNAKGLAELDAGRMEEARVCFEQALDLSPRDVLAQMNLAVTLRRLGRQEEAVACYEQAILQYQVRPSRWRPDLGKEAAELALLHEQRGRSEGAGACRTADEGGPLFTVLLGCYGNFPQYSIRAMESIAAGENLHDHCQVLIGLNECCAATTECARRLVDSGVAAGLVESRYNLNKDPMLRLLVEQARTPYVLWLDDDSHFVNPTWPRTIGRFVSAEHPLDVAGELARWGPRRDLDRAYQELARGRPWWIGNEHQPADLKEWIPFLVGGMFIARTEFLRRHDFPDRGMIKALDDVLLGELIQQRGGRMVPMPRDVLSMVRISNGQRRGVNYLLVEGGAY